MTDPISEAVVRVLSGLARYPPEPFLDEVNHRLRRSGASIDEAALVDLVTSEDPNEPARVNFNIQLARWDTAEPSEWSTNSNGSITQPGTATRRARVLQALELTKSAERINAVFPVHGSDTVVITDEPEDWDPWYTPERADEHHFYWDAYRGVLESKMDAYAVGRLDDVTTRIVRRLADPSRSAPYQSKGLVVGHVQSGKTANYTGVIAKAIDAGYRLVIVLTGTINILRSQTQRRIDMELIGRENILGGIDLADTAQLADVDYAGNRDRDWVDGKFVVHGVRPRDVNEPEIQRLTRASWDYKALAAGLSTLDFRSGRELADPRRPLYDAANLYGTDVRIAVVKKNRGVLEALVKDLSKLHTHLAEIPTLIIDDESDQASVNTRRNRTTAAEKERTAINKKIAELLGNLSRAQYIGYTATPFANVFVDPDDEEDLFPRDFIISLEAPTAYMGGRDFHDLDPVEGEWTAANSNEKAYVRGLTAGPDDHAKRRTELRAAIDAFVLTGAVKLWRAAATGSPGRFRHHTMLIHEAVEQKAHDEQARTVHDVWNRAGYSSGSGLTRLRELWHADVRPGCEARAGEEPIPEDFDRLRPYIGEVVDRVSTGSSPVVVINGDKESDYQQADLDFQTGDVWKMLVGGTKLSRGFTVEGLTVSYYTRRTTTADTLMQMGRWFGYRAGYRDLVRLYVGRCVPGPRGSKVDLYKAFEAIVRDEEDFRAELRAFQGLDTEGRPKVRPIDVPPLVFQSLPWLRPTAANKMYNAELTFKGEGGRIKDFFQQPPRDRTGSNNVAHFAAVQPLLAEVTRTGTFFTDRATPYCAHYGVVAAATMRTVLTKFRWNDKYDFSPTLEFVDQAVAEGTLVDWLVLVPIIDGGQVRNLRIGNDRRTYSVLKRERRADRDWVFSGSSPRQRLAIEVIAGGVVATGPQADPAVMAAAQRYPDVVGLHTPTRGAMLLTFAADDGQGVDGDHSNPARLDNEVNPCDVATLFSLAFPKLSAPTGRVAFKVRVASRVATVDRARADL